MNSLVTFINQNGPLLLQGAVMTIQLFFFSASISFLGGIILGIMQSNRMWIPFLSSLVASITFVLRAVPFYVQLLIVYFVLPAAFGISLSAYWAGIIALGVCSGSYTGNIVRAGINAIPIGQWEACYVLGFSKIAMLRFVILPQMLRTMLPALMNELESILKSTSIIASIGVLELTRMGMNIVSREMKPIPIYCAIAIVYVIFSACINIIAKLIDKKMEI